MSDRIDGILMLSGGLDSIVTAHILKSQGLNILALHYILPFYSGLGLAHAGIRSYADELGIPLRIIEEGEDFFVMVQSPRFGFGKNANPCMDCRIHRLAAARLIMEETGASFIATGEVVGQRPKSQRLDCLQQIENRAGLAGRLLRPLSALLLEPTLAEQSGLVDRGRLMGLSGRSRQPQLSYAREHGLRHNSPAGGCLLTAVGSAKRYLSLVKRYPDFSFEDFRLIAFGRHFPLNDRCRLVIARDDGENDIFEKIISREDIIFDLADIPGPMGIGRGDFSEGDVHTAAAMVARYSRARAMTSVRVKVYRLNDPGRIIDVAPADPSYCESVRLQ